MSHTRAASLSFPPPEILRIDHSQANPLKLALSWDPSAEMPASMTLRAEIHASRSVGDAAVPLSAVSLLVSANDAQPWELTFSSQQTNLDLGGKASKQFALTITGIVSPTVIYTLASADLVLQRHPCSQLVPVAVSPLLYATSEDVAAIDERVTAIEENGGSGIPGPQGPPGNAATIQIGAVTTGAAGTSLVITNTGTASAAVFNFTIPRGDTGAQGPQGIQGPQGLQGLTGSAGAAGAAATVTVGTVTTGAAGTSATVTNVGTSSAAVFNFVIPRGNTGATGAAGAAATVTVGTVTTLPAGSAATVTNVGTSSAAVLNFGIPQGADGTGGTGGATIALGTVTTGAAGTSVVITNTGTASAAVFNFTIPRGDTGAQGPQGIQGPQGLTGATGAAATVTVGTVTTGAAGTSASVTNSGSASAAVFNFVIPRGDTGATGAAGTAATVTVGTVTTGAAGSAATVTNVGTSSAAVFNFVIPRGDTGATGPQGLTGAAGAAATVTVGTVTTLPAGSAATVTNVGTSSSAVLNFGIPQGAAGTGGGGGGDAIQTYRASQLIPATTNGAGVDSLENGWNRDFLTFPLSANRYAELEIGWPTGWVGYQYRVIWRSTGTTGNVIFTSEARCFADSSSESAAAGTAVSVTDSASGTAQQVMVSDWSATVTPGGSVADGAPTQIRIGRLGLSETSPLSQTVWVQMIQLRAAPV